MGEKSRIAEFYAHRSVLITGATGFIGKVLIWKLLYSCSLIEKIYILLRSKRNIDITVRRKELLACPIFDNFRKSDVSILNKVVAIQGDVAEPDLGISEKDRTTLINNVSVIFHGAALLKMDASLKDAINVNTEGVLRMIDIALQMKQLQAFIYVSTAYCCCDEEVVKEELYPINMDPISIINLVHVLPSRILDKITSDIIEPLPNTYTFSKRVTENLLVQFQSKLPLIIARPTIVISAFKEPFPGWVDSVNGCIGVAIATGKGVLRTMLVDPKKQGDLIPVDIVCNALIAIPWSRAEKNKLNEVSVFNVAAIEAKRVNWREYQILCTTAAKKYPFEVILWYPKFDVIQENKYLHYIESFFYHLVPALVIDLILRILKKRPFMMRLHKKISNGLKVLEHFSSRQWSFRTDNLQNLKESMNDIDKQIFTLSGKDVNNLQLAEQSTLVVKKYIFNEDLNNIGRCRIKLKLLFCLNIIVQGLLYYVLIKTVVNLLATYFKHLVTL